MIAFFIEQIVHLIDALGYGGILTLMALESAGIPIPSEITMPFAGFLVNDGRFNFWLIVAVGAFANLLGSLVFYWLGAWGGRPFFKKYGRYFLVSLSDLDLATRWFTKYGSATAFFSRLLPIVRTYISFPAGVARMNVWKFSIYTFAGSIIWSLFLVYGGMKLGENWAVIHTVLRKFDYFIIGFIIIIFIWWIKRHTKTLDSKV